MQDHALYERLLGRSSVFHFSRRPSGAALVVVFCWQNVYCMQIQLMMLRQ